MRRSILNTTDLMGQEWQFLKPQMQSEDLEWHTFSSLDHPERWPLKRRLQRLQAARSAVRTAKKHATKGQRPVLISHLPNMAAITNTVRRRTCPKVPQIAFSFNFTELPQGMRQRAYRRALQGIDEFVVFSNYERDLYADYFDIPLEKIHFMHWAMDVPAVATTPMQSSPQEDYVCAIGGEARDYSLFAQAMRNLPNRKAKLVARPYSIEGINFPDNVEVHLNLPSDVTWRLASDSVGMALPLLSGETTCGHITFVVGQLLGIPIIATQSVGLEDYLKDGMVFARIPPQNADELTNKIEELFADPVSAKAKASAGQQSAQAQYALNTWIDYLKNALLRL